ncbi:MAG: hypothetical protein WBG86_17470 [Polyangiales bacterium]
MFRVVRVYASEEAARAAVRDAGKAFDTVGVIGPDEGSADAGIKAGFIDPSQSPRCARALRAGQWVVGVSAPFGYAVDAERALERHDPIETIPIPMRAEPAPLSSVFGIPVLSKAPSSARLMRTNRYILGEPKLSKKAAPFSSTLGMRLLSKSQRQKSTFGMPLLSRNGAPFSSMFRLPLLTRSQSGKSSSFGFPLLSDNPTPLSSLLGLRVLSKDDDDED